jgi:hypothetical protein
MAERVNVVLGTNITQDLFLQFGVDKMIQGVIFRGSGVTGGRSAGNPNQRYFFIWPYASAPMHAYNMYVG